MATDVCGDGLVLFCSTEVKSFPSRTTPAGGDTVARVRMVAKMS